MIEINPYSDIPYFVYDCLTYRSHIPSMVYELGEPRLHYLFQAFQHVSKASKALQTLFNWSRDVPISRGL